MKGWLFVMLVVGGCRAAGDIAIHGLSSSGGALRGKPLESSREEIRREQDYQTFQQKLLKQAGAMRTEAISAAAAGR